MAITVDVQPAFAAASGAAVTSASFTPTNGSLLVACVGIANGNDVAGLGSSAITDTGSHTWTLLKRQANSAHATAEVWVADNASTSAITVTATSQVSLQVDICLQVISYNGAAAKASQTGATAGVNDAGTVAITTTVTGSQVVGGYGFSSTVATLTAAANTTIFGQNNGGAGDTDAAFKATSLTGTPGSTTLGCTEGSLTTQALAFAEILAAGATAKALADTHTLAESLSLSRPAALADTAALADSLTAPAPALADSVALADTATLVNAIALADSTALTDTLAGPTPALTDTTTLTDTTALVAALALTDTTTDTDSLKAPALALTDTTALADAATIAAAQSLPDTTTLADSLTGPAVALADAAALADSVSVGTTPALVDTTTLADSTTIGVAQALVDTTTQAESVSAGVTKALADTTTLGDVLTTAPAIALADTTTLADTAALAAAVTLTSNTTALSDTATLGASPALSDTTALVDTVALVAAQALADTAALTDSASVSTGGTPVALADTTALADSMAAATSITPTDTTALSDSLGLSAYVGDYAGSLLPPGSTPPSVAGADTSVCLGEVFYLSSPRVVTGVQYYKADSTWDSTDILVAVYDPSGSTIATATRTQQAADPVGWIQVPFSHAAVLTLLGVGNQYTVAYRTGGTDTGHYPFAPGFFASDYVNGSYTVPAGGGRFRYVFGPAIDRPDNGTNTSYLVDVVSTPVNAGGDDSATLNDTLGVAAAQALADTVTNTDTMTVQQGVTPKTLTDATAVADTLAVSPALAAAEATTMAESLSIVVSVPMADATTLADSIALVVVIAAADTTTSAGTLSVTANISQLDTLAVADSLDLLANIAPADTITVTDTAAFNIALTLSDLITMTEKIQAQVPRRLRSESQQDRPDAVSSVRTPRTETTRR